MTRHAGKVAFGEIMERAMEAAAGLPDGLIYAGLSLRAESVGRRREPSPGRAGTQAELAGLRCRAEPALLLAQ